ncbi:MAG: hypothetical protein K2O03_11235, partial [Lachnospiraceae bacterium]|nr:hypothetical protein [Lachnospiraceae bacterium]
PLSVPNGIIADRPDSLLYLAKISLKFFKIILRKTNKRILKFEFQKKICQWANKKLSSHWHTSL